MLEVKVKICFAFFRTETRPLRMGVFRLRAFLHQAFGRPLRLARRSFSAGGTGPSTGEDLHLNRAFNLHLTCILPVFNLHFTCLLTYLSPPLWTRKRSGFLLPTWEGRN